MTLLERFDKWDGWECTLPKNELRRAIAIAQAVENWNELIETISVEKILNRADELLRGEP